MRLLIVDDEPAILRSVARCFVRRGAVVREALSGAAAIAMLADEPADIVITDLNMPGMSGLELLRHVADLHPSVHRVLLSGSADQIGPFPAPHWFRFLCKPCSFPQLVAVCDELMHPPQTEIAG